MPLLKEPQDHWHWTQAIAWIAFDDPDSENGDLMEITYRHRHGGGDFGRKVIKIAIRELCEKATSGDIKPIWKPNDRSRFENPNRAFTPANCERAQETLFDCIFDNINIINGWRWAERLHFMRADVLSVWGPSPDGGQAGIVTYETGAPGRPSSMHLIEPELDRRAAAGEIDAPSQAALARSLSKWLAETHPSAAPTTPKTIENDLRDKLRRYVTEAKAAQKKRPKPQKHSPKNA